MANILLTDRWEANGTDINEFERLVKEMDSITHNIRMPLGKLQVCTYGGSLIGDPKVNFVVQEPMCTTKAYLRSKTFLQPKIQSMSKEQFKKELSPYRDELIEAGFILAEVESKNKYIVSPYAVKTLCRRVNLGGEDYNKPTFIRDLNIATQMSYYSEHIVTLVTRTDGSKTKVYAVMSNRYTPIKQSVITEIYKGFEGKYADFTCRKWEMSHIGTKIYIEFPNLADQSLPDQIIPGIMIETSDCGESSFQALGTQRVGEHIFYTGAQVVMNHTDDGTGEIKKFLFMIKEKILTSYSKLPNRLEQLEDVVIDTKLVIENFGHKLRQAIGKKATLKLLDSDFSINSAHTAYQFCIALMKNNVESMGNTAVKKYRIFCNEVAFYDFEKGLAEKCRV